MMNKQKELRVYWLLLFYFFTISLTFADKFSFINRHNWGINYQYWEDNATYLRSGLFWLNLFLLSLAPALFIRYFRISTRAFWPSLGLPLYWSYLLFMAVTDTGNTKDILLPGMSHFIYFFTAISAVFVVSQVIILNRNIRRENKIEVLEKFKVRAMKKLAKVNPQLNQKLFDQVLGNYGEALKLLVAATYEKNPQEKDDLTRAALNCVAGGAESIEWVQKRLTLYATISESED